MSMTTLRYDVSLTDGQSARWAGAMTTPMALAVASRLAAARPAAIEVASVPPRSQQCVARGEDPLAAHRAAARALPRHRRCAHR